MYEKAAYKGSVIAQYNLGIFYEKGYGVSKDLTKAIEWYTKAANQGNKEAQDAIKRLINSK